MARTHRAFRAPRASRPRRDVTWGYATIFAGVAGGAVDRFWVFAPSRADPDPSGVVPNAPVDITVIRMLPIYQSVRVIAAGSPDVQPVYLGLIAWAGTDAAVAPTDFPLAQDGVWDWMWRAPAFSVVPAGVGGTVLNQTTPAPVWTDIHSQRKMGEDMGLLLVLDNTLGTADVVVAFDVRYAFKLPW